MHKQSSDPTFQTALVDSDSEATSRTSYLVLLLGGTGSDAGRIANLRWQADARTLPITFASIDTDQGQSQFSEFHVGISLSPAQVEEIRATAPRFGAEMPRLLKQLGGAFSKHEATRGARTIRPNAQIAAIYYEQDIVAMLRQAIDRAMENSSVSSIQPVFVGSKAGGTGSALSILISELLHRSTSRARVLIGHRDEILRQPLVFVTTPTVHIRNPLTQKQGKKIAANEYAFDVEAAEQEKAGKARFIEVGYSNSGGEILATRKAMVRQLGNTFYEYLDSRFTDALPSALDAGYLGPDVAENLSADVRRKMRRFSIQPKGDE